jgi:hypothetical protein
VLGLHTNVAQARTLRQRALQCVGESQCLSTDEYALLPLSRRQLYDGIEAESGEHGAGLFQRTHCAAFAFLNPLLHHIIQASVMGFWKFYDKYPEAMNANFFFSPALDRHRSDLNQPCTFTSPSEKNPTEIHNRPEKFQVGYY